ncbi:MAG TPA: hypothetical protein VK638_18940 [Edaphobacter sp.]|nr:hypothetical protein [Edaphobacter sp.]
MGLAQRSPKRSQALGEIRSGTYFALLATTNKVGYAVAIRLVYPLLDGLGFSPQEAGHGTLSPCVWQHVTFQSYSPPGKLQLVGKEEGEIRVQF